MPSAHKLTPFYQDEMTTIYCGDCRDVLPHLTERADTVITDPPYGLEFMGRGWDNGVPGITFWLRVLHASKPGAMLLSFGGTRTWHRIAVAIEDAGWVVRDTMMWLYGSGFPKSENISKDLDKLKGAKRTKKAVQANNPKSINSGHGVEGGDRPYMKRARENGGVHLIDDDNPVTKEALLWDGWGTALKPAWEPIIVAMHDTDGTFAQNALLHGVSGMHIDGARVGSEEMPHYESTGEYTGKRSQSMACGYTKRELKGTKTGRWPANIILDEEAGAQLDEQSGVSKSRPTAPAKFTPRHINVFNSKVSVGSNHNDEGGASRFFYCAKASKKERGPTNKHPTVKPLALMEYLCVLTQTPTGGLILDPFMGSGSTVLAARRVGRRIIAIDQDKVSCQIAVDRIKAESQEE